MYPYAGSCHSTRDCVVVEIGDLVFTSITPPGGEGYGLTGLGGWLEGSDATGGPVQYEVYDGGIETRVDMRGRNILLEGEVFAPSRQRLWEMCDALGKLLVRERWGTMYVQEPALGMHRQMRVCRLRRPQITMLPGETSAIFTLELQSAVFEKLDIEEQRVTIAAGSSAVVDNIGDYPAHLYATITGPLTNPRLSWPGGTWRITNTVAAGSTRYVEFSPRLVRDPVTAAGYRHLSSGDWPKAEPGRTTFTFAADSGTGSIELWWRSAWS